MYSSGFKFARVCSRLPMTPYRQRAYVVKSDFLKGILLIFGADMELDRLNGRLERILKELSLRLRLFFTLEFILVLALAVLVALLGGLFTQNAQEDVPYLPFVYYLTSLIVLVWVFLRGIWRIVFRLHRGAVARGMEEKFPRLKDDVTNALLLFQQVKQAEDAGRFSRGLVAAHLRKTVGELSKIGSKNVVRFKSLLPGFVA